MYMTALAEQPQKRSLNTVLAASRGKPVSDRQKVTAGAGHNSEDYQTKKNLLVTTYLRFRKEEGEHYVLRCQVVVEAEDDLPSDVFKEFCNDVDLPRNSCMFRKARTVANAANRLLAVASRLPDSKSTIYELAKVDEHVFQELFDSNERITAARVKAASPGTGKLERCVVSVDVTALAHGERLTLLRQVQEAADQHGAKIKVPKSLHAEEARP
jgi:hypothetical protein